MAKARSSLSERGAVALCCSALFAYGCTNNGPADDTEAWTSGAAGMPATQTSASTDAAMSSQPSASSRSESEKANDPQATAGGAAPPVAGSSASTGSGSTSATSGAGGSQGSEGSQGSQGSAVGADEGGQAAAPDTAESEVPADTSHEETPADETPANEGGAEEAAAKPPCLSKASQLIAVGDSYLNWITHNFPEDFRQAFGGEYRMYAVGGASMASGGISGFIPDQMTTAIADDPDILAAVMTGGGNDILIADTIMYPESDTCKDRTDADTVKVCQDVIANAMKTAGELMKRAGDAGIKDVVYLYYPHIPGGGFGGMNPNVILEYSLPMARDMCASAVERTSGALRCHFLNLQPVFEGHPDWFADDGIHENELGSAAMAKAVVEMMEQECIAQPESSGCCAP